MLSSVLYVLHCFRKRYYYSQWFLNFLEVPIPASFMRTFTEPFIEIQNIFVNKLEPKAGVPKSFERRAALHFFEL